MHIPRIVIALLLLLASACATAAEPPKPRCGGVYGLCGYIDAAGSEIGDRRFEKARQFRSGLAAVRLDGLWGFVNEAGEIAIAPRFEAVGDFLGKRAMAAVEGRAGIIDREGNFVIPPRFSRAIPFTNDVALVSEDGDGMSNRLDSMADLDLISISIFGPLRLYHQRDGWLTSESQKFDWFRRPQDGVSGLIWAAEPSGLYGLMDERGSWVVQPRFIHVQALHDGRAVVQEAYRSDSWGAVDESGRVAIPLKYPWLSYFENGYALLGGPGDYQSRKQGIIRADGTVIAEPIFDKVERSDNRDLRGLRDGIWYRIESDGKLIPTAEYKPDEPDGSLIASCPQGLGVRTKGARFLIEDADGRAAFSEPVDQVEFGIPNDDGSISGAALSSRDLDCRAPIVVSIGDYKEGNLRSTYVRPDGRPLFDPPQYFPSAYRFYFGHAVVGTATSRETGKWGIINAEGQFTLPLGSEPVRPEGNVSKLVDAPIFTVGTGDTAHLTDAEGKAVPEVDAALDRALRKQALSCADGARIVGDGERFGMVDADGKVLIPAIHRAIGCYRNGVAFAARDDLKKWCPIGTDGAFRDAPACLETFYPVMITHHFPERFADDRYENSVLWVQAGLRYGLGMRSAPPRWIGDGIQSRASYSIVPFRP